MLLVLSGALALPLATGCHRKASTEASASAETFSVSDASKDLLLTWIDARGEFHVESSVAAVPAEFRETVRVVDPARDADPSGKIFVVDLRSARADGTYAVRAVDRETFERIAVERRQQDGGQVLVPGFARAPSPSSSSPTDGTDKPTVIIYGASWCGPCHQAQAYLKQRGIPFIEKDIEADRNAAREMRGKLASAGKPGGSIPVLDVRGKILIGFDPGAVEQALAM